MSGCFRSSCPEQGEEKACPNSLQNAFFHAFPQVTPAGALHHNPATSWPLCSRKTLSIPFSRQQRTVGRSVLLFLAATASGKTLPRQPTAMWLLHAYFLLFPSPPRGDLSRKHSTAGCKWSRAHPPALPPAPPRQMLEPAPTSLTPFCARLRGSCEGQGAAPRRDGQKTTGFFLPAGEPPFCLPDSSPEKQAAPLPALRCSRERIHNHTPFVTLGSESDRAPLHLFPHFVKQEGRPQHISSPKKAANSFSR